MSPDLSEAQQALLLAIVNLPPDDCGLAQPRSAFTPWSDLEAEGHDAETLQSLVALDLLERWHSPGDDEEAIPAGQLVTLTPRGLGWLNAGVTDPDLRYDLVEPTDARPVWALAGTPLPPLRVPKAPGEYGLPLPEFLIPAPAESDVDESLAECLSLMRRSREVLDPASRSRLLAAARSSISHLIDEVRPHYLWDDESGLPYLMFGLLVPSSLARKRPESAAG